MDFQIEKVYERDIDLLVINKFMNDNNFKNLFLNKLEITGYNVINCIHSYSDKDGENDITIIISNGKEKIGILIEDKINAIAMKNQSDRYKRRGETLKKSGTFDKYYIFIIAPNDYLKTNEESKKYEYRISYEEILETVKEDSYAAALLSSAINEKKNNYSVVENKTVTDFWNKYYDLVDSNYPSLSIKKHTGPRGSDALWPIFSTPVKGLLIYHKSDKGYIDLTFPGLAEKYYDIYEIVKNFLGDKYTLQVTGKSLAIRANVSKIDFRKNFASQIEQLIEALDAVQSLQELLSKINYELIINIK